MPANPVEQVRHDYDGFRLEDVIERGPYAPEVEYQSRRAYIFARRPETAGC